MAKESRAKAAMGGGGKKSSSKKSKKHKVHKMHIRHAANGGYIAEHEAPPSQDPDAAMEPSEEHALPDMQSLQAHIADHMAQPGQPAPAAPGGAPAPAPSPAPAPAGPAGM